MFFPGSNLTQQNRWICIRAAMMLVLAIRCPLTALITFTSNKKEIMSQQKKSMKTEELRRKPALETFDSEMSLDWITTN